MLVDRCAKRAATVGILGFLVLATGDLAAQSGTPAGQPAPVVRPIEEAAPAAGQAGDPAAAADAIDAGMAERSPFAELNEALAAARAKLEELNEAAAVAASIGQLRQQLQAAHEESRQLRADLDTLHASRGELQSSNEAAQVRIAELTAAVDEAAADASRLGGQVDVLQGRNAEIAAKEQALSEAAEQAGAELAALREELEANQRAIAVADGGRQRAEARVQELQEAVQTITEESTGLREELAHARDALASAARDRTEAQATSVDLRAEADQLRNRLATAEDRVSRLEATNARLSADLQAFRAAASSATDAARQNLEAVESRVEAVTAALTAAHGAARPEAALDRLISETRQSETDRGEALSDASVELAADGAEQSADVTAIAASQPPDQPAAAGQPEQSGLESDVARAKQRDGLGSLAQLTAGRPLEKKLQLQALLTELKPAADERGLLMTVPGGSLFKVNSDDIEETAYDTLAKLAELINAYDDRTVLIVGHTDAIGDAAYNQMLSERRTDLVKQFFVDNFEIDSARVSTAGKGEEAPIASNSTNAGRRANRRVEVLLLN
jgi:outer membrane protein OmpA-like peptidoglycan-associated protein/predicted  nucleic acid-binding Zn-ribbon protein